MFDINQLIDSNLAAQLIMEKLIELVNIVNQVKVQRIELIGRGRYRNGQKIKSLYDGIAKGKFKSDEEAALAIYGEDYKSANYAFLKHKLIEKLLNTLFFIKLSDTPLNDFQKAYYEIEKQRATVKILLAKGAKKNSIDLAEKIIKKSLMYELTDISLELARILRRHFRMYDKKKNKASKYNCIVQKQLAILNAEVQVENYYELLMEKIADSRGSLTKLSTKANAYAKEVKKVFPSNQSNKLNLLAHLIFILEYEVSKDFVKMEEACKAAIEFHEAKKATESIALNLIFYIKLLSTAIPLKKFREGKALANKILDSIGKGSINWFLTLDYYFLLSMHTANYKESQKLFKLATGQYKFEKLNIQYKEVWLIYDAYLEYLKVVGLLPKTSDKNFRVARFINQVPKYSKDKTGINISILVIQVLLLIAQKKEPKVIDRVEALRSYVYTHLRNDESLRSNIFIKMLLKMVESNFHKNGTIRRTKALRKKLEASPIGTKGYSQYVEIIPYETLWEISLRFLSNRAF